jgi:ABC-type sugar transport system ATPase subunit
MSLGSLWRFLAVALPVLASFIASLASVDLAYQLRAGHEILASGSIPATDTWTFTANGAPWLDQQWGAQVVLALIERLGLGERRRALPRTLSGGEKQRVAIARALINAPPVILADEPTGNLDSVNGQEVLMILHDVARDEGCSVILVTHDPRVEDVADRILWLEDGQIRDRKSEEHARVRDPVCGMWVDEWAAENTAEHRGERFVFCSRRCLERFEAEPERYAARAGAESRAGRRG